MDNRFLQSAPAECGGAPIVSPGVARLAWRDEPPAMMTSPAHHETAGNAQPNFPPGWHVAWLAKTGFDLLVATLALLLLSPLLLAIAMLIKLDGGPALYGHRRIGRGGRQFRCFKFRTMVTDAEARLAQILAADPAAAAEWAATQKLTVDPRVTPLGGVLRRTSLDELPQLFNVLRGEMSLVGPRPIVLAEVPRYAEQIAFYYAVRPGVTGLWQVSGRSETSYARRVQLDVAYVRHWSLGEDLSILLKTVPAVLARRGAV